MTTFKEHPDFRGKQRMHLIKLIQEARAEIAKLSLKFDRVKDAVDNFTYNFETQDDCAACESNQALVDELKEILRGEK